MELPKNSKTPPLPAVKGFEVRKLPAGKALVTVRYGDDQVTQMVKYDDLVRAVNEVKDQTPRYVAVAVGVGHQP